MSSLMFTISLSNDYYYSHFADEEKGSERWTLSNLMGNLLNDNLTHAASLPQLNKGLQPRGS